MVRGTSSPADPTPRLEALFERIDELERERGLLLFPVRHHSPACARHLRDLIRRQRPSEILIEGPRDFDPLVPLLLHRETRAPVAIYATYQQRFAAYYPFCDTSPELVALREGARLGVRSRFIDLTFPEQVRAEGEKEPTEGSGRARSLVDEGHLRSSRYVTELCRRFGCRDFDELWDELFESRGRSLSSRDFRRQLLAYCHLIRAHHEPGTLLADGTLARERGMAASIRDALDQRASETTEGPILVVAGGFHAVALPELLLATKRPRPPRPRRREESTVLLTRYSFEQVDTLAGYSSGMPAPWFYQRLWELDQEEEVDPEVGLARELLVEVSRRSRSDALPDPVSTADVVAATAQCQRLAGLRGRRAPSRIDLLDAARSAFVKSPIVGGGVRQDPILSLLDEVLRGEGTGRVPRAAGLPPILVDFRRLASRLRLDITTTKRRNRALDLYRKAAHRRLSRFFHSLLFLQVPFALPYGGPDFRRGVGLDLMQEHWEVGWSPKVETALVEASVFGSTVEEAALTKLRRQLEALEAEGRGGSAAEPVELLVVACRMGLHRQLQDLVESVEATLLEDPSLRSLVEALDRLLLLWQSQEPLEAHDLVSLPRLAELAYRRACLLLRTLGEPAEEELESTLTALASLREHLAVADSPLDPELFLSSLTPLFEESGSPALGGAAAGLLYGAGCLEARELIGALAGHLGASREPAAQVRFLRGLLKTARETLWQLPDLLEVLDAIFQGWEEEAFVVALPHLRLAFSSLSPREVDRVASAVQDLLLGSGERRTEASLAPRKPNDRSLGESISRQAVAGLARYGLADWIATKASTEEQP